MSNHTQESNATEFNVSVTFRHTESTPALKAYAVEKMTHCLEKYVHGYTDVHVILSVEKHGQVAEAVVHSNPYEATAKAETDDLYSAIDKVVDILTAQIRKQKGRVIDEKHRATEALEDL